MSLFFFLFCWLLCVLITEIVLQKNISWRLPLFSSKTDHVKNGYWEILWRCLDILPLFLVHPSRFLPLSGLILAFAAISLVFWSDSFACSCYPMICFWGHLKRHFLIFTILLWNSPILVDWTSDYQSWGVLRVQTSFTGLTHSEANPMGQR